MNDKEFEKEFAKLSEKDKREVNNLIRFMQEKKYHDKQYEKLLNQYIELSRDYDYLQSKIDKVNQYLEERFIFDDENGEYYQTHTFDKDNAKELHDILKEE